MASPDRIALAADAGSPVRVAMRRLGDAATCSTSARDVSDWSASTTTTPSPRITGWLNTAVNATKVKSGTPNIRKSSRGNVEPRRVDLALHQQWHWPD